MQAVVSMCSSTASPIAFLCNWSFGYFLAHLNLLPILVMLLCDRVSRGLLSSFIFHFTSNITMKTKSQNTKAKHSCSVDHEDENMTGVGCFDHYWFNHHLISTSYKWKWKTSRTNPTSAITQCSFWMDKSRAKSCKYHREYWTTRIYCCRWKW